MSTGLLERQTTGSYEWISVPASVRPDPKPGSPWMDSSWFLPSPVEEAAEVLFRSGFGDYAERLKAFRRDPDMQDDELVRSYVSELWSSDWDSDEDQVYDTL